MLSLFQEQISILQYPSNHFTYYFAKQDTF